MPLLIDGYNLLHASDVFGHGTELTELHRSREALLRFLAAAIADKERAHTTIVFDAADAPPGLPQSYSFEGMLVQFAREAGNADAMLEDLIEAHDTPRTLVVVSSDHRVQRAARRRRAKAVDSERWWTELCAQSYHRGDVAPPQFQKPASNLSAAEIEYWVNEFSDAPREEVPPPQLQIDRPKHDTGDSDGLFPPGYGEDLLDDDS